LEPYLSIVITGRNDDHGRNFLKRLQIFLHSLAQQCDHYSLNAEIVLVEWNPPAEKPAILNAIRLPETRTNCKLRIIQVPAEIHRSFKHSDQLPLFQMRAKNVGIRRARGKFVLATNPDIIFADELIGFLASQQLSPKRMYRVDRYDVSGEPPADGSVDQTLQYCRDHILRVNGRYISFEPQDGRFSRYLRERRTLKTYPLKRAVHTNGCGDFTLVSRQVWNELGGYPEWDVRAIHVDALLCIAAHFGPAPEQFLQKPNLIYHIEHERLEGDANVKSSHTSIPTLSWHHEVYPMALEMSRKSGIASFNDKNWGMAQLDFPEEVIG
jgi:hypothetical protein